MLDSVQNLATFLSFFYVKFRLCSTNAMDARKLDLDLLKLLEKAKPKIRDSGTLEMVDAVCVKLKGHLWYLSNRLVPPTLFSVRITDRDKKEMANAIFNPYQNSVFT